MTNCHANYPAQEKPFEVPAEQAPIPVLLIKLLALNSFLTLLAPRFCPDGFCIFPF
jgi:hypothetical protein